MSDDIERLRRRIADLERTVDDINDFTGKVRVRLKRLEEPKPEKPDPVTCPECGGTDIESKGCTAIIPDRGIQHRCRSCEHYWRVNIKGAYLPEREESGQVYRIVYRTVAGAKPTFIHVRADSETRALMAFIDGTSPLQVSAVQLDNEYDGPLLNGRENFWPANDAKRMEEVPPPGTTRP